MLGHRFVGCPMLAGKVCRLLGVVQSLAGKPAARFGAVGVLAGKPVGSVAGREPLARKEFWTTTSCESFVARV